MDYETRFPSLIANFKALTRALVGSISAQLMTYMHSKFSSTRP